jgi:serine/threonine-protein kinase RsbW
MTAASIGSKMNFNIDDVEDIKVIVSEISIFFINYLKEDQNGFEIVFQIHSDRLEIIFLDLNAGELVVDEDDLSLMILQSLSDDFQMDIGKNKAKITKNLNRQV